MRKWHRWMSVFFAVVMVWVAITGAAALRRGMVARWRADRAIAGRCHAASGLRLPRGLALHAAEG